MTLTYVNIISPSVANSCQELPTVITCSTCSPVDAARSHASRPLGGCLWGVLDPPSVQLTVRCGAHLPKRTEWSCRVNVYVIVNIIQYGFPDVPNAKIHMIIIDYIWFYMIHYGFKKIPSIGSTQPRDWILCSPASTPAIDASGPHASDLSRVKFQAQSE